MKRENETDDYEHSQEITVHVFKYYIPNVTINGDVARDDSQRQFLAKHSVATLLRPSFL